MLLSRRNGVAIVVAAMVLAGCASPQDPFANQPQRPSEICLDAPVNDAASSATLPSDAWRAGAPQRYVVKKGDTLWDISKRFLQKPWYWKKIWYANPHIKNPHWIYPGDVLGIVTVNGQPRVSITQAGPYHGQPTGKTTKSGLPIVAYNPAPNAPGMPNAAPVLPGNLIAPFILKTRIFQPNQLQNLPFVFGDGQQYLTLSQAPFFYTKGLQDAPIGARFEIYRKGGAILDYDAERARNAGKNVFTRQPPIPIGYQMDYVGEVGVLGHDPVTGLTKIQPLKVAQPIKEGDVLLPPETQTVKSQDFFPRLPSAQCLRGYMLQNTQNLTLGIKAYDSVVTSFGEDNGAQVGDVWKIVTQPVTRQVDGQSVTIPGNEVGYLMIYKVYPRVSLGFVLESTRLISTRDVLVHP